jgi:hypothetical protein
MIMAGGTGGHIFPALAVAEFLHAQGWNIVWLGAKAGMEARVVPPKGYAMAWVRFSGVRGKGFLRMVMLPLNLLIAFWQSARAIFRHRPDVVLGMGGYITFPGGMMASLLNRPLAIHERSGLFQFGGGGRQLSFELADPIARGSQVAFGNRQQIASGAIGDQILRQHPTFGLGSLHADTRVAAIAVFLQNGDGVAAGQIPNDRVLGARPRA